MSAITNAEKQKQGTLDNVPHTLDPATPYGKPVCTKVPKMNDKEFDETALLALFYESDHFHDQIRAPFMSDGYVCATETHRLILIKPELCKGEYAPGKLSVKKVMNPDNINITITLSKLKKAVKKLSSEEEMEVASPANGQTPIGFAL